MNYNPKSYRKFMAASVAATVAATSVVALAPVNAAEVQENFSDVEKGKTYYEAVKFLKDNNIVEGFGDGTYRPEQHVSRGEAAKMVALALGLDTENVVNPGFTDLAETSRWYKYVAALADAEIVTGFENKTYKADQTVTRSEMAKMIALAYDLEATEVTTPFLDVDHSKWHGKYIAALFQNNVTTGKTLTSFAPYENVNRGQMALFVYRSELLLAEAMKERVSFEFGAGFDSFVAGVEGEFTIEVTATNVSQDRNVRYRAVLEHELFSVEGQEIQYEIADDVWASFTIDEDGIAYFGPEAGFKTEDIDLQDGVVTNFKTTFEYAGEYNLVIELVDVDTNEVIGEAGEIDFEVAYPAVLTFSGLEEDMEIYLGEEFEFSVAASLHELYSTENKNLRFMSVVVSFDEEDILPVEGLVINFNEAGEVDFQSSFTTDENGEAFFGPQAGLSELAIAALKSGTPVETDFKATINEAGLYGVFVMLVEVEADGVTVLDNGYLGAEFVTFEVK